MSQLAKSTVYQGHYSKALSLRILYINLTSKPPDPRAGLHGE